MKALLLWPCKCFQMDCWLVEMKVIKKSGHTSYVNDFLLVNDQILASSSEDRTIRLWNIITGNLINTLTDQSSYVRGLTTVSSNIIASACVDKTIKIWNTTNGSLINTLSGHTSAILLAIDMLNNNVLVSGSQDQTIRFWSIKNGSLKKTINVNMTIESLIVISR